MYRYFSYDLTGDPSSIFKESFKRKTKKLELRKAVTDEIVDNIPSKQTNLFYLVVLFFCKICWIGGETYQQTTRSYAEFVTKTECNSYVIFDCYTLCTRKDHVHLRSSTKKTSSVITVPREAAAKVSF